MIWSLATHLTGEGREEHGLDSSTAFGRRSVHAFAQEKQWGPTYLFDTRVHLVRVHLVSVSSVFQLKNLAVFPWSGRHGILRRDSSIDMYSRTLTTWLDPPVVGINRGEEDVMIFWQYCMYTSRKQRNH